MEEDVTFNPPGAGAGPNLGKLVRHPEAHGVNPRSSRSGLRRRGRPPSPGGGRPTSRGAFAASVGGLWTDGWTVLNGAGLMADGTQLWIWFRPASVRAGRNQPDHH